MKKEKKIEIAQSVMEKIKKERVKMKSKLCFVLGSFFLGLGIASSLLITIFLINLISFRIRAQGQIDYLRLGRLGQRVFFQTFPWTWFFLAIVGILGGIFLLRKLDLSYQKNFIGIIAGIIGFVIIFGFFVDNIGLNRRFAKIPLMKGVYQQKMMGKNFVSGKISKINKDSFIIVTFDEKYVPLALDKNTVFFGKKPMIDQYIKAVGIWENDQFLVRNLKTINYNIRDQIFNHKSH